MPGASHLQHPVNAYRARMWESLSAATPYTRTILYKIDFFYYII